MCKNKLVADIVLNCIFFFHVREDKQRSKILLVAERVSSGAWGQLSKRYSRGEWDGTSARNHGKTFSCTKKGVYKSLVL